MSDRVRLQSFVPGSNLLRLGVFEQGRARSGRNAGIASEKRSIGHGPRLALAHEANNEVEDIAVLRPLHGRSNKRARVEECTLSVQRRPSLCAGW